MDKRSKVIADTRTSQLVLVATEKELVEADQLVARLDTPTKEVLIEAKLVELQKNPTTTKGVDWSGTLQAQHMTFGNGNNVTRRRRANNTWYGRQRSCQPIRLLSTTTVPLGTTLFAPTAHDRST